MSDQIISDYKQAAIVGNRPADVPEDWIVLFASRPILGDMQWQDRGFFVAIDPNGGDAHIYHRRNEGFDAYIISFFSEEEAYQAGRDAYIAKYSHIPRMMAMLDDDKYRAQIIATFIRNFGK